MLKNKLSSVLILSLIPVVGFSASNSNYFSDYFSDKIKQEQERELAIIEKKKELVELRKKAIERERELEEDRLVKSGKKNLYFVGIEGGLSNTKLNGSSETVGVYNSLDVNRSQKFYGIKFGRNFDAGRLYVEADQYLTSTLSSDSFNSFSVNADYFIQTKKEIKPFVGLNIAQNDFIDKEISFGAGFGFINNINNSFDIEMGYKLNYLGKTQNLVVPYNGSDENVSVELKYFHKFYIGLNYKF